MPDAGSPPPASEPQGRAGGHQCDVAVRDGGEVLEPPGEHSGEFQGPAGHRAPAGSTVQTRRVASASDVSTARGTQLSPPDAPGAREEALLPSRPHKCLRFPETEQRTRERERQRRGASFPERVTSSRAASSGPRKWKSV